MFNKAQWIEWKKRGTCLRYVDQYKTDKRKVIKVAPKYEGYLFIPEEDFKKIRTLYNFYRKSCDFYQEKYERPIGRVIFDKTLQQHRYMLTTEFIAKELLRTRLQIIMDLAKKLGNFNKELLTLEAEHNKFIEYLLRKDKYFIHQEIIDDESIYD